MWLQAEARLKNTESIKKSITRLLYNLEHKFKFTGVFSHVIHNKDHKNKAHNTAVILHYIVDHNFILGSQY